MAANPGKRKTKSEKGPPALKVPRKAGDKEKDKGAAAASAASAGTGSGLSDGVSTKVYLPLGSALQGLAPGSAAASLAVSASCEDPGSAVSVESCAASVASTAETSKVLSTSVSQVGKKKEAKTNKDKDKPKMELERLTIATVCTSCKRIPSKCVWWTYDVNGVALGPKCECCGIWHPRLSGKPFEGWCHEKATNKPYAEGCDKIMQSQPCPPRITPEEISDKVSVSAKVKQKYEGKTWNEMRMKLGKRKHPKGWNTPVIQMPTVGKDGIEKLTLYYLFDLPKKGHARRTISLSTQVCNDKIKFILPKESCYMLGQAADVFNGVVEKRIGKLPEQEGLQGGDNTGYIIDRGMLKTWGDFLRKRRTKKSRERDSDGESDDEDCASEEGSDEEANGSDEDADDEDEEEEEEEEEEGSRKRKKPPTKLKEEVEKKKKLEAKEEEQEEPSGISSSEDEAGESDGDDGEEPEAAEGLKLYWIKRTPLRSGMKQLALGREEYQMSQAIGRLNENGHQNGAGKQLQQHADAFLVAKSVTKTTVPIMDNDLLSEKVNTLMSHAARFPSEVGKELLMKTVLTEKENSGSAWPSKLLERLRAWLRGGVVVLRFEAKDPYLTALVRGLGLRKSVTLFHKTVIKGWLVTLVGKGESGSAECLSLCVALLTTYESDLDNLDGRAATYLVEAAMSWRILKTLIQPTWRDELDNGDDLVTLVNQRLIRRKRTDQVFIRAADPVSEAISKNDWYMMRGNLFHQGVQARKGSEIDMETLAQQLTDFKAGEGQCSVASELGETINKCGSLFCDESLMSLRSSTVEAIVQQAEWESNEFVTKEPEVKKDVEDLRAGLKRALNMLTSASLVFSLDIQIADTMLAIGNALAQMNRAGQWSELKDKLNDAMGTGATAAEFASLIQQSSLVENATPPEDFDGDLIAKAIVNSVKKATELSQSGDAQGYETVAAAGKSLATIRIKNQENYKLLVHSLGPSDELRTAINAIKSTEKIEELVADDFGFDTASTLVQQCIDTVQGLQIKLELADFQEFEDTNKMLVDLMKESDEAVQDMFSKAYELAEKSYTDLYEDMLPSSKGWIGGDEEVEKVDPKEDPKKAGEGVLEKGKDNKAQEAEASSIQEGEEAKPKEGDTAATPKKLDPAISWHHKMDENSRWATVVAQAEKTILKNDDEVVEANIVELDRKLQKADKLCEKFSYEYEQSFHDAKQCLKDTRISNYEALLIQGIQDNPDKTDRRTCVQEVLKLLPTDGILESDLWAPVLKRVREAVRGR
jgi:hypothetical protein